MKCNTSYCTILFGLLESTKISLFKDLVEKIIEAKVSRGKLLFFTLFRDSVISRIKTLNKVILDDSDRPNMIVQIY